jgi:hypothetical protein
LGDERFAEPFDVHDAAGSEVKKAAREAGGTVDIDAAVVDFAFGADNFAVAVGAVGGEVELLVPARVLFVFDYLNDFGDDVTTALDFDVVADEEAEALDFVGVVEGGAGDGGASNGNRGEDGDRGELTGAADLDSDVFDLSDAGAGGELEGDSPAGGSTGIAEAALDLGRVDLDNDAIDFVTETVTSGLGFFDEGENFLDGRHGFAMGIDAKADGGEGVEGFGLLGEEIFAGFGEEEVGVEVEAALGDDVGLEGADCSSSVVAWIGGGLKALGFTLFVCFAEGLKGHDDFAANFKGGWDVGFF